MSELEYFAEATAGVARPIRIGWRNKKDRTMSNVNEPIPVARPEPRTVLESALLALESNSSKLIHLSPRQAEAVLIYIKRLKRYRDKSDVVCQNLAVRLAEMGKPTVTVWDNETDEVYDE